MDKSTSASCHTPGAVLGTVGGVHEAKATLEQACSNTEHDYGNSITALNTPICHKLAFEKQVIVQSRFLISLIRFHPVP